MKSTKHIGTITKEAPLMAQENKDVLVVYGFYEGAMAVKGGLLALGGYLLGMNVSKDGYSKGGNGTDCDFC